MSIGALTTIAAARNTRPPTRADAGAKTADSSGGKDPAKLIDIVSQTIPAPAVAAYTAFIAIVSEVVHKPTLKHPHPQQHLGLRWIGFAILVAFVAGWTIASYYKKAGKKPDNKVRFPWLELSAVMAAAVAWGLALPDSPLLAHIQNHDTGVLTAALIAFAGAAVTGVLGIFLKQKSKN